VDLKRRLKELNWTCPVEMQIEESSNRRLLLLRRGVAATHSSSRLAYRGTIPIVEEQQEEIKKAIIVFRWRKIRENLTSSSPHINNKEILRDFLVIPEAHREYRYIGGLQKPGLCQHKIKSMHA